MKRGTNKSGSIVRERTVKLVFSLLSIVTLSLLSLLKVEGPLEDIVTKIILGFSLIIIFIDFLTAGLSRDSYNTEALVLLGLLGLVYSKAYLEAGFVSAGYLFVSVIQDFLVKKVDIEAKKYGLTFRSFEKDFSARRDKYHIMVLILVFSIVLVSKLIQKLDNSLIIYRISLSLLTVALLFFEKGFPLAKLAAMIRLCKDHIYLSKREDIQCLNNAKAVIFEKEALTRNSIEIHKINPKLDYTVEEIKELLAYGYFYIDTPLRPVFLKAYGRMVLPEYIGDYSYEEGTLSFNLAGENYNVGDLEYISKFGLKPFEAENQGLTYYIIKEGLLVGSVELKENLDEDLFNTIERIRRYGLSRDVYLSQDGEKYSLRIARFTGIEELYYGLDGLARKEKAREIIDQVKGRTLYVAGEGADERVFDNDALSIMIGRASEDSLVDIIIPQGGVEKLEEALQVASYTERLTKIFIFINAFAKTLLILFINIGRLNGLEVIGTSGGITLIFLFLASMIVKFEYH